VTYIRKSRPLLTYKSPENVLRCPLFARKLAGTFHGVQFRGTSLIRNYFLLGPCSRPMPKALTSYLRGQRLVQFKRSKRRVPACPWGSPLRSSKTTMQLGRTKKYKRICVVTFIGRQRSNQSINCELIASLRFAYRRVRGYIPFAGQPLTVLKLTSEIVVQIRQRWSRKEPRLTRSVSPNRPRKGVTSLSLGMRLDHTSYSKACE